MRNTVTKLNNQVDDINYLAIQLLERMGVIDPSQAQIDVVEDVILNSTVRFMQAPDKRLSEREMACLYWAAQGKSSQSTANILGCSQATIEWMRKQIKQKLHCANITQAVFKGVRYGYIQSAMNKEAA